MFFIIKMPLLKNYTNFDYFDNNSSNEINSGRYMLCIIFGLSGLFCVILISSNICIYLHNSFIKYYRVNNFIKKNKKNTASYNDTCPICIGKIENDKLFLKCKHGYHKECFKRFIKSNFKKNIKTQCPLCNELCSL